MVELEEWIRKKEEQQIDYDYPLLLWFIGIIIIIIKSD